MAQRGICSRREADKFIKQGMVMVDGEVVDVLGTKIQSSQIISLDLEAQRRQAKLATILINKPSGFVSGLPEKKYQSAIMLINKKNRQNPDQPVPNRHGMAPAGRLDIDSTGLIIFTQDGRLAKKLIGPKSTMEKEYIVHVDGEISEPKIALLRYGLALDGQDLKPTTIEQQLDNQLRFILTEGKKRQIRRMCELVDLKVTRLNRTRIGNISLGNLPRGKWRLLNANENF